MLSSSTSFHLNLLFLNANYVNMYKGLWKRDTFMQIRPEFEKLASASKDQNQ